MTLVVLYIENISVVILIRTDTTLDHSQKAEKVCIGRRTPDLCEIAKHSENGPLSGQTHTKKPETGGFSRTAP